jgi:hypothetical protein
LPWPKIVVILAEPVVPIVKPQSVKMLVHVAKVIVRPVAVAKQTPSVKHNVLNWILGMPKKTAITLAGKALNSADKLANFLTLSQWLTIFIVLYSQQVLI